MPRDIEQQTKADDKYRAKKYDVAPKIEASCKSINTKRRKKALKSLFDFITTYGPGVICDYPPPPEMRSLLDDMERVATSAGRYQIQMSRGFGKTTYISGLGPYMVVKGFSRFVEVIAATDGQSKDIFDKMCAVFEGEKFAEDFPEIAVPFRESGGNSIKMSRLTHKGEPLKMEKTADHMILPRIPGLECSGAKFVIRGFTSKNLRGLNILGERPDFIVLDDIQDDKMAKNSVLLDEAVKKINGTIRGQFGHHKDGTILMTATPIFPGDLSDRIKDDPSWVTKVYPMMRTMPTNRDLWDKYGEVLRGEIAALAVNSKPELTANQFYKANRKALDEGAEPHSPHIFNRKRELSAIQHAMNIIYTSGEDVFLAEYQMKPQRTQSLYDVSYKTVLNACNGCEMGVVPKGFDHVIATIDVMSTAGLRYVLTAFGPEREAAVIGYGRFPADGAPLFNRNDSLDFKNDAVRDAVDSLLNEFRRARYRTEDGGIASVFAVGIDAGWQARAVHIAASRQRPGWATLMKGQNWVDFTPYGKTGRKRENVISVGEFAYTSRGKFGVNLMFHSDHWTEVSQQAWFSPVFQPGSLSLFGKPEQHLTFAQECVADQLVEKDKTRSGEETWKWATNGPNHFGDCVKMAFVIANWGRLYMSSNQVAAGEMGYRAEKTIRPSARRLRRTTQCI